MDQGEHSKALPEGVHQILSHPVAKVPIIKGKRISYEDEEEEQRVSHSNQDRTESVPQEKYKETTEEKVDELWGDDIDESCLAGVLDTQTLPTTVTQQQSEMRESDVWGAEEDWLTENNELERSLVEMEALHKGSPSFKKKIQVKRQPICYDSDEESTPVASGFSSRREMTREEKLSKECGRKKRLKMLLS